jgi:hypothetical protein
MSAILYFSNPGAPEDTEGLFSDLLSNLDVEKYLKVFKIK